MTFGCLNVTSSTVSQALNSDVTSYANLQVSLQPNFETVHKKYPEPRATHQVRMQIL